MFQLLRRVSGSLLPRPDRPWRDDATSHAPTIGRKRRYSVTEQDDDSASTGKRAKNNPVKPDTEHDSASEGESPREGVLLPVEGQGGQEVKEVTKGVKEVDLEDKNEVEDPSSIQPEGVPLPESPPGSPEPDSESPAPAKSNPVEETSDQEHTGDTDADASSAPEDDAEEEAEAEPVTADSDASPNGISPAHEITIVVVESGIHGVPEALEVKA